MISSAGVLRDVRPFPPATRMPVSASRFGVTARGVVFAMVGVFVARAALEYDPESGVRGGS